jgi:hypothetical protein
MIQPKFRPAGKRLFLDNEVQFTSYIAVSIRHTLKFHSASAAMLDLFWNETTKHRNLMALKECKWNKQGRQCAYNII